MPTWNMDQWTLMYVQVATGFMGALTLVFMGRMLWRKFGWMFEAKVFLQPGGAGAELLVQSILWARREVMFHGPSVTGEALVNAFTEAKKRGANVEIMLDPRFAMQDAEAMKKLVQQGLDPWLVGNPGSTLQFLVVIDQKTVLLASPTARQEDGPVGVLVHVRGNPELAQQCRDHLFQLKAQAKPLQEEKAAPRLAA